MAKFYVVQVNDVPSQYQPGWFPRRFRLLADAKKAAQEAVDTGASLARVEYPNGAELDFRPAPKPEAPLSRRDGNKVGWEVYATEAGAKARAKTAREEAKKRAAKGYDFGYQSPGSIRKVEEGWEVCVP